jgi:ADP-ribose pyrophosphatase
MDEYLEQLPAGARITGDTRAGEIEVVTEPAMRADIAKERGVFVDTGDAYSNGLGIVFEDKYVLVVRDPVRFPSGATGTYLRIFERSGLDGASGVVVVPVRNGEIFLRRVFRHATRAWELECPRGFRNSGESPEQSVRRELEEELGIAARDVLPLGQVMPNTGLLASAVDSYVAYLQNGDPDSRPEAQEAFGEIIRVSPAELRHLISTGEIRDGITLAAIMQADARGLFVAPAS